MIASILDLIRQKKQKRYNNKYLVRKNDSRKCSNLMEKVWRGGEVCGKGVEYDRTTYPLNGYSC